MFSAQIYDTPFTSQTANELIPYVRCDSINGDVTLLSVMRALLATRTDEQHSVYADISSVSGLTELVVVAALRLIRRDGRRLAITNVRATTISDECHDYITRRMTAEGFRELLDLRRFVSKHTNACFYISDSDQSTIVFVENMSMAALHMIASLISRLLPWYFKDHPLDADEVALLKSLNNRYERDFMAAIHRMAERFDFERQRIESLLRGIKAKAARNKMDRVQLDLRNVNSNLERLMNDYKAQIARRTQLHLEALGLESVINGQSDGDDLIEYTRRNKSLYIHSVDGATIRFYVKSYLDMFDPELYEMLRGNTGSFFYATGASLNWSAEDMQLLFDHIFGEDADMRVKILSYYKLNLAGNVDSEEGFDIPDNCRDRIVNPHVYYFDCLGDHRRYINEMLLDGNVIGAIEQCVASAKSLNLAENPTASKFFRDVLRSDDPVIVMADGSEVNAEEALRRLKGEEQ